jgi:GTP-binding protein
MTEGNFVDYVKVHVSSGKGGKGSIHLHREKYITKGGPDGGDGGRGGHVIIQGDKNLWTLLHFKFQRHFKAGHGGDGSKNRSTGADGEDCVIRVPLGTVILDTDNGEQLAEISDENPLILLHGGKGGRGNWHFKSPTRQTPRYAQPGLPGAEKNITLELKVLADVGLVGFPNAGKSTLLAALTSAKPKIADYEFTTLKPNLGIVQQRDYSSFVMADIPGIIEGAAEGKGLGHYFLRHIERNSILLYVIPADAPDLYGQFTTLQNELQRYNPQLLDKNFLIAISKSDLLDDELKQEMRQHLAESLNDHEVVFISSIAQTGLTELKDRLWIFLND